MVLSMCPYTMCTKLSITQHQLHECQSYSFFENTFLKSHVRFSDGAASLVYTKTGWVTRSVNGWGGGLGAFGGGLYPHHQLKAGKPKQEVWRTDTVRWRDESSIWVKVMIGYWVTGCGGGNGRYLRPSHWATRWIGRSWRQVSARGRKHHLWGSPAHCRLATSSWWSCGHRWRSQGAERQGRSKVIRVDTKTHRIKEKVSQYKAACL